MCTLRLREFRFTAAKERETAMSTEETLIFIVMSIWSKGEFEKKGTERMK
jgi:hypothetical protein